MEVRPLALDAERGLVHPPTLPHKPLAAMKRFLQRRTVLDDLTVNGGMIHVDTAFEHQFFEMACAQRTRHIPADAGQNDFRREVGPLEAHRHRHSPSLLLL
jgi:hypothetical protein